MLKRKSIILILFFPHIIHSIYFIIDSCKVGEIFLEFFQIIINNFGFYATCFSLIWAINEYFKMEKVRQEENFKREKANIEIRSKEIEKYKDSFRPNFVLSQDGNRIILIMKNVDYYLENVCYYKSSSPDTGKSFITLRHNDEIDLEGESNNYYITAETMIGEKIIFGVILNKLKIYKTLRVGGSPIVPSDFSGKDIKEKINENWVAFNENGIEGLSKTPDAVDINFMIKTEEIRQKMGLNITEHSKIIISQDTIKTLFKTTLSSLSNNRFEFHENVRKNVIIKLLEILDEDKDKINTNLNEISEDNWCYIKNRSKVEIQLDKGVSHPSKLVLEQYIDKMDIIGVDNIISVLLKLIEYTDFTDDIEYKLERYKYEILMCIEN